MSWVEVVGGALTGISNFFYDLGNAIGGALNADTIEGLLGLGSIVIILRVANGGCRKTRAEFDALKRLVEVRDKRVAI